MDKDLKDLIHVSNEVGKDPDLIQGGGGNTSVKTGEGRMYVKASGTALKDMCEGAGYRLVDLKQCLAIVDDSALAQMSAAEREREVNRRLVASCLDELKGRPSVESSLHAQLGRCIVHTHPSLVNGLLCARDGRKTIEALFSGLKPPHLYVEYVDFGYPLAVRVREELEKYRKKHRCLPKVTFLENHGLFISTETAEESLELTRQVFDAVRQAWRERMHAVGERHGPAFPREDEKLLAGEICGVLRRVYAEIFGAPVLVCFTEGTSTLAVLRNPECERLVKAGPLVPDQVVYCNDSPLWMTVPEQRDRLRESVEKVVRARQNGHATPVCLLVDGLGMFTVGLGPKLLESALVTIEAVLDTLTVASCFGGVRSLAERAVKNIRDSEVEAYRQTILAGERESDPLCGRVAVVSGAGSGLGRGISIGLAKKGVHVVLADIDEAAARETARRIVEQGASGSGWPAKVDVTSEGSVAELFEYAVTHLGGVDALVNAAGIAPPYALIDFPLKDWDKTLDINLTGYFLMAREAARVMKRQGTGGNIINLSSKTGLDASRNNSAYNATKSAEIHLARGWALELAEYGIRVNAVCPGNVFRESRIWNEEYIKAQAKKRGIKPEEVIPYYINLSALKVEIDWDDIASAVAFLISPAASKITGQTLVVDAGQVFVR